MKNNKESFSSDIKKYRTYFAVYITVILAIVILINMIFSSLNLRIDLTTNKLYTISDITIGMLKNLNSKIKITVLADESTVPLDYKEIVDKYKSYSKNIEVVYKDPQKNPRYFDVYTGDKNFSEQSIIVEKVGSVPLKYRLIVNSDLMASQGSITQSYVEKGITDAISYVTSDKARTIYLTEGHQEMELDSTVTKDIENRNYEVKKINLNNQDIPLDATDMILMFSPQSDLSQTEVDKIKDYLSKGGRMLFSIDYTRDEFPNLKKVINAYGLDLKRSIIIEGDGSKAIQGAPYIFIPSIQDHKITEDIKQGPIYLSSCMPIMELDTRKSTLEITPILKSSVKSYDKMADSQSGSIEKEASDTEGPFNVAELVIDKASNTGAAKDTEIMVVSTSSFANATFLSNAASQLDLDFLFGTISFMTDNPYNVKILPKDNISEILKEKITVDNQIKIGICIIVLPLLFFTAGGVVWYRRKSL